MKYMYTLEPIAKIHTDFSQKFGIPRQSGMSNNHAVIEFLPKFRDEKAVRGLEEFSHIWLLWDFSLARKNDEGQSAFEPMVRPPRLGGDKQMGVFATRSPFRPNNIGLSSVRLIAVDTDAKNGPLLYVEGADILDETYVFDIKPYLKYTDSHPDATLGWTSEVIDDKLFVELGDWDIGDTGSIDRANNIGSANNIDNTNNIGNTNNTGNIDNTRLLDEDMEEIRGLIAQDPRPHKNYPSDKVYHMAYKTYDISFTVSDNVATICRIHKV